MICYKDMTFCKGDGCKHFDTCPRALTEEVIADAREFGLPVAQFIEPTKLDCYEKEDK